jgi:putative transcription factor
MCGKETQLMKAVVEGTQMNVCRECSSFGKVVGKVKEYTKEKKKKEVEVVEEPEIIQAIVPDYAAQVKKARESMGLKQEELAKKINEKESVIHKVETGHYEPNMALAQKLGKFLKITLVEEHTVEKAEKKKESASAEGFTIGDIIKKKG